MAKNKVLNTVLGVLLSIALVAVIIFEIKTLFGMIENRKMEEFDVFTEFAKTTGKASVSIDEIVSYPEVDNVADDGDVILLDGYNVKIKLNGTLTDDSKAIYNKWTYSSAEDHRLLDLSLTKVESGSYSDYKNAIQSYFYGRPEDLIAVWGYTNTDLTYLVSSSVYGDVPVILDNTNKQYHMFIECDDSYVIILTSTNPFKLTDDKVTVHYGDPGTDPYITYSYNKYEEVAADNTIRELLEGDENSDVSEYSSAYQEKNESGTADAYTSKADEQTRASMASLANYTWSKEGTSDETTLTVDITSEEAKKSEWVLTDTTYTYISNGLKIYGLGASRSSDSFYVEGTIGNTLETERPYVLLIKYIDTDGGLLGISVIDHRTDTLEGSGVDTFNVTVSPVSNKIDIQKINSVMFEVY